MIDRQEVFIKHGDPVFLKNGVKLEVSASIASRPSAILISAENGTIEIPSFTDSQINNKFELMPIFEVVYWNDIAIIVGLPSIVIVYEKKLLKIDLFRKATDDSGFYAIEWLEDDDRLFCIYEGGIISFNRHGEILWHIQKAWDDIFTSFENGDFILMEPDGKIIGIDSSNGFRKTKRN
ncbi:hypothetical protein [Lysobacter hankyongensis]|uniref:Uncharacterized protein n=1 Tax=Lysobacter hankyongensis TaxID=1176535 RepID=A0ABP9B000_9GAMM